MRYRVFAQAPVPDLPIEEVQRLSTGVLDFVHVESTPDAPLPCLRAQVGRAGDRASVFEVTIVSRYCASTDWEEARRAAALGRAAGMDSLAERCPTVHEVIADEGADENLLLELCAAIAAASLGPILPPDGQTLLGVRSARLRARG